MPLPRFERLAPDARAAILAVARTHFARDGKDAASFNQIIADSGISKTTAYHYFDGKDDLFAAVVADTVGRTLAALGDWADVAGADALLEQVADGARRLATHLREHPDDRAVLAAAPAERRNPWIERLVANGLRIGLIDPYPDAELTASATAAVISAVDDWALHRPGRLDDPVAQVLTVLLKRLWNADR
jgi:TetR/AcrR family transcriptional regulator of autoinduction and epiphytic fitness